MIYVMMIFVLYNGSQGGAAATTTEFLSKEACEAAIPRVVSQGRENSRPFGIPGFQVKAICVAKGQPQ